MPNFSFPLGDKALLAEIGWRRVARFCRANGLALPPLTVVPSGEWTVDACAYYRPDTPRNRKWTRSGVNICLERCARPCPPQMCREWSWPGSTVDRTVYGVLAHEVGYHADWITGERKWTYGSEYCEHVMTRADEPPLTGYEAGNPAEWFAEAFRLLITNPALLAAVRPATYAVLLERWTPVGCADWTMELGANVPVRVVNANRRKAVTPCRN